MRRSRLAGTTAAFLALSPLLSACTVTFGEPEAKTDTPAATQSATPAQTPAQEAGATPSTPDSATPDTTTAAPAESTPTPATTTTGPVDATSGGRRQKISVPANSGIQSMELIDLYGADTSSGAYGRAVGVFDVTTDRPMLLNLRVQLFDAAGKEIASNDGLNPAYAVGRHHLVTSNLIELPKGVRPSTFKVSLIDTTDMHEPVFTAFATPHLTTKNGVPALTGSFTYKGTLKSGMDSRGACVMPDGTIYEGQDGLTDNPTSSSGDGSSGTYTIPLYEAPKGVDFSRATCYASI